MTYDVPVKLLSFHLILLSLFLLAPDLKRLANSGHYRRSRQELESQLHLRASGPGSNDQSVCASPCFQAWGKRTDSPKYRRKVLEGKIAKRSEQVIRKTATKYRAEIIGLEITPDHVHLLVEIDPQFGIYRLIKNINGVSSHVLRKEFESLRTRLPSLWTNAYLVSTVGGAPIAVIKQYVENQKNV